MGNATSIFNLLRNLGGSIGIASVTTLIARYQQVHINVLGANVTASNPQAQTLLSNIRSLMMPAAPTSRGRVTRLYLE